MKPELYFENSDCVDHKTWKKKAKAFAIRSHSHLWGKNNEDPLSYLYLKGLNLKFISKMYLGWNKFGHNRPYERWGLSRKGAFYIPSGIVFPFIENKEITRIFVLSMKEPAAGPGSEMIVPGSANGPLILGPGNRELRQATGIIEGLNIFQEDPDLFRVNISLHE